LTPVQRHALALGLGGSIVQSAALLLAAILLNGGRLPGMSGATALLLVTVTAWCLVESSVSITSRPVAREPAVGGASCVLTSLTMFAVLAVSLAFPSVVISGAHLVLGTMAVATGIALRAIAITTLRENFHDRIVMLAGQKLVRSGIYSRVRHPSESGLLLVAGGAAIMTQSAGAIVAVLCLVSPLIWYRIHEEDRMLAAHLGPVFDRYRARVPAIVPRGWQSKQARRRRRVPPWRAAANRGTTRI
jgi:protein-S-isoprenylcysteine O-methyltransferase Ste14